jgi:hypothetical protein
MKVTYLMILLFIFSWELNAQIVPDFMITNDGADQASCVDSLGNLHTIWFRFEEGLYYTKFDSLGNEVNGPHKIPNAGQANNSPDIATNQDYIITAWRTISFTFNSYIRGELFNIGFDSLIGFMQFNDTYFDAERFCPSTCWLNDSTFIVVWTGNGLQTPLGHGLYGQIVTTSLNWLGPNLFLTDHSDSKTMHAEPVVISSDESDDFVVIWLENYWDENNNWVNDYKIWGRKFYGDGTPQYSSFLITENPKTGEPWSVRASMDSSGNFAVIWWSTLDTTGQIQWRWFNSDGIPLGPSEKINSAPDSSITFSYADVAIDDEGKSVAAWVQKDNKYKKVYAQRFSQDRTPLGESYRVATILDTFDQSSVNIDLLNGKIYTSWKQKTPDAQKIWANIIDFYNPPVSIKNGTEPRQPYNFILRQNYPNPFNSTTIISYDLKVLSDIRLTVFDLNGRKIKTLASGNQPAGNYNVSFYAAGLASGVYYYRLQIGKEFVKTKKLVLLK